ncbi:sulfotransferase family protein [Candidatus Venteria ishoeyi]|uniref:Sulfotransferase domain protein n=1 Tax=Candidatus Venteria ishoeyi TaxID=1899563 RepID=A0A1H6FAC4_9GAMM|nr:sulfotransferase [Candidatus Venteria ishoeyi]MDM8546497.1 sulfotransferase [Candidatus Venteria ishoeyi]SEH06321.1 Sulfotransferase domain protein [Candidatus Venteria ishoeyi]
MLDFLGIGAQKAGTTWVYKMLCLHPQIHFPAGKEQHFWDRYQYVLQGRDDYPGNKPAIQNYRAVFNLPANSPHLQKKLGEITPAYGILDQETIQSLYNHYPKARLFYIIRNPIERAWSSALMALKRAEMEYHEASAQWFMDHFHSQGSLQRGDYETSIRRWTAVYPREQLLVLPYESIALTPRLFLAQLCRHLEIEPYYDAVSDEVIQGRVFAGSGKALPAVLRQELESIYNDKIHALSIYLGQSLHWL